MSITSETSDSLYSKQSISNDLVEVDDLIASLKDEKASAASDDNSKLHTEVHLAIITDPSQYASSLCEYFFTLYRDVQRRPFVLQFLPSFVIAYYDLLHQQAESADATIKDVCSTIDTFLVGIYNLGVLDDGYGDKTQEIRIPNLTLPSIYHTPNPDHYAPTPLTQHAISKHEKKYDVIHTPTFPPFDTLNATTSGGLKCKTVSRNLLQLEQILWFLLIQYGAHVSAMDACSRQAYLKMSKKLISQGFSFEVNHRSNSVSSILPPTGRRIYVSGRVMTEILATLSYLKANSADQAISECMRSVKHRAEYEMYADVLLMTESLGYLHEFESQRPAQQDMIGIEIELPPTVDVVKQKRSAITTRSIKHRQRSHKHHQPADETAIAENDLPNDTIEHLTFVPAPSDIAPTDITPPMSRRQKSILDVLDENSPTTQFIRSTSNTVSLLAEEQNDPNPSNENPDTPSSSTIDETRSNIASSIGLATSNISPSSPRHYKPLSLASTQAYFSTIQQQQQQQQQQPKRSSSPNIQNVQTVVHDRESLSRSRTSSIKHGEKRETVASVRFAENDQHEPRTDETFL